MVWMKWVPWRFTIRFLARRHGFVDPIALFAKLHRFAQPAEVAGPIELLRAGMVMHARGLINSKAIQHNLDWVWPYWVERQFNPRCSSFVPRAFSITHINLTHRNWTAVGIPDCDELPIIDPRGLFTPFFDSWSLDTWIITEDQRMLLPSRQARVNQYLAMQPDVAVVTEVEQDGMSFSAKAYVEQHSGDVFGRLQIKAAADAKAWCVVALRPYNPEGISFIHELTLSPDRRSWTINQENRVIFSDAVDRNYLSNYHDGDVFLHVHNWREKRKEACNVGMLTAAAMFELQPMIPREIGVSVPLPVEEKTGYGAWGEQLQHHCSLRIPDKKFQFLYDAAVRTLILHSPKDVYPGPFTYKRFWFRDAAYIIYALLCGGLVSRAERALHQFSKRQSADGYFLSQEGEWDSNGEALWIMCRFCEMTGTPPHRNWIEPIWQGAQWIDKKRTPLLPDSLHAGLLPAGFSAEHLGPNDYYYWDDYWGIAGLQSASRLLRMVGDTDSADNYVLLAESMRKAVERSLEKVCARLGQQVIPASPYRRLDAGAVGSIVAGYPLQLVKPDDERLLNTVEFLLANCMIDGGFFQDMIHSGINAYLTLQLAQVLLRAGSSRFFELMRTVADFATPTGQWPEAIHPRTKGGCMGDGQHVWAAADWLILMRNCFVREEGDALILAAGIPEHWLNRDDFLAFGPAPTSFGSISLTIALREVDQQEAAVVSWEAQWHAEPAAICVRLAGFETKEIAAGQNSVQLFRESSI